MPRSDVICTGLSLRAQANRCLVQLVPKKFIAQLERGSLHPLQCWPPSPFLMSHELPVYLLLPAVSAFSLPEQSQKHMLLQTQVQCAQTFGAKLLQGTKFFSFFFFTLSLSSPFFSSWASKCEKDYSMRSKTETQMFCLTLSIWSARQSLAYLQAQQTLKWLYNWHTLSFVFWLSPKLC